MKDVVIIGSGAGGGPLAYWLSQAGMDTLVLEKGPRYRRRDYFHDELLTGDKSGFFRPTAESDPHVLVHGGSLRPNLSQIGWIGRCAGGGTERMGGYLYRFHPDDFRLRSRFGAYKSIADWPYTYRDLEPYYVRAEWEIGVSGSAGANPFEGPRSKPYPMPPVKCHPLASFLERACRKKGLNPFPTPRAINSQPYQSRPACSYCDFCGGYGCPTGAKGSSQESFLRRAEAEGRCEIRPHCMVRKITTNRKGLASGCLYLDRQGRERKVEARAVCVSCSAVESARLLLMSCSPLFPDGLANGSGLVGRHLQFHIGSTGRARFRFDRHEEKRLRQRGAFLGRSVMDYYFLPRGVSDFPKGGLLRFGLTGPDPISNAHRLAREDGTIVWGKQLKRRLWEYYHLNREAHFEVFQDFIPNDQTYLTLDPEVKDPWGLPAARIHLSSPGHHRKAGRWLVDRGLEIFEEMGADRTITNSVGGLVDILVHSTCRAGHNPAASVLNAYCQAHEVANLFVVDGSFMPTSGGAPPTLTICANSLRTADYILERFRTGDLH